MLLMIASIALAVVAVRRRWPIVQMVQEAVEAQIHVKFGVPTRRANDADDEFEDEAGELLNEGEDAGVEAGPSLAVDLAAAAAMSADATQQAAVACAAAHALLSAAEESKEPDGAVQAPETTPDVPPIVAAPEEETAAKISAVDADGSVVSGVSDFERPVPSPRSRDPELPAIGLGKSLAAFDTGELFESMPSAARARAAPEAPAPEDESKEDEDDDGYFARPHTASQYRATNKHLAASLD